MPSDLLSPRRELLVDQVAAVLRVATGSTPPQEQQRVLPEFVAGASIGPAPREAKGRDRG